MRVSLCESVCDSVRVTECVMLCVCMCVVCACARGVTIAICSSKGSKGRFSFHKM